MGMLDGKVAFISGAARGQGRSHATRLAEEGADIVAIDIAEQIDTAIHDMGTEEDLAETVRQVEALDRRIVAAKGDVRVQADMDAAVQSALAEFGHIDVVVANAGIFSYAPAWELTDEQWQDMIDVILTGTWRMVKAAVPSMIESGRGGSIIITSSTAGLKQIPNSAHYVAAKTGLVGLMKALAVELAPHNIRVNTVHPTTVSTPMIQNSPTYKLFRPDLDDPSQDDAIEAFSSVNLIPVPWVEPRDISNAVLWLASQESRFVTGHTLPVDAGFMIK
ncbi:mycofactocin-coupled SDR family oxidoreductase [Nocardioides sp.]|uniref:mycofactocin-coupled SDR family oxidoreductase n=1 Tax=Nocardioides sp. TaxID=35761 RepID=UPI003D119191